MLIGIMSDTHDNLPLIEKAIDTINRENVELVLHAGDYIAPFVVPKFSRLRAKMIGVFGNNDGDHELLQKRFSENKTLSIRGNFANIEAAGLRIALLHGNEEDLLKALIGSGSFEVVVHGHSHDAQSYRKGNTLVICPGEVCGYLTGNPTVAIFDTEKTKAQILKL